MASKYSWQKAATQQVLTAAVNAERDLAEGFPPDRAEVDECIAFTKRRASEDIAIIDGIESLIAELDMCRAVGAVATYGYVQDRLRALLGDADQDSARAAR